MTGSTWPTPDRTRLVAVEGARVFVTDVGPERGAPLLLLHDVLCCGHAFASLLECGLADRRVLVPDLPGCGESDRPAPHAFDDYRIERIGRALEQTLVELGVERCEVWGQGLGGLVAMELASRRPDKITRLVAIGLGRSGHHVAHEMRLATLPAIGALAFARAYRRADLERTMGRWRARGPAPSLTVDVYWDRLGRKGGMEATCELLLQLEHTAVLQARLVDALRNAPIQVVLVWGDRELIGPQEQAAWRDALPSARTIVLEACGHAVVEERPDALIAALAELPAAGAGDARR